MNILKQLRIGGAFVAFLALAGCLDATGQATGGKPGGGEDLFAIFSTVSRPIGDPLPQAPIAGGEILVKGPNGYCVDGRSLRNRASGGFALLASCYVMTGGKDGAAVTPVVMTVSASRADAAHPVPDAQDIAEAIAPARVLTRSRVRGLTVVQIDRGGDAAVPDADPRHWRGAMELNGFVVSLAVYGPEGSYAADKGGSGLIVELADALRLAKSAPPRQTAGSSVEPQKTGGLLGGLFQ